MKGWRTGKNLFCVKWFLKSDLRIDAYGCVDELSSLLGSVASYLEYNRPELALDPCQEPIICYSWNGTPAEWKKPTLHPCFHFNDGPFLPKWFFKHLYKKLALVVVYRLHSSEAFSLSGCFLVDLQRKDAGLGVRSENSINVFVHSDIFDCDADWNTNRSKWKIANSKTSRLSAAWRNARNYDSCLELDRPYVWSINGRDMWRTCFPWVFALIHQQVHEKTVCDSHDFFDCIRFYTLEPWYARRDYRVSYRRSFYDCISKNEFPASDHAGTFCHQLHRLCRCDTQVNVQIHITVISGAQKIYNETVACRDGSKPINLPIVFR